MDSRKIRCNFQTVLLLLAVWSVTLSGCKDPIPTADSIDQSLAGIWQLDREATWDLQFKILKEKKLVTSQGEKEEARRNFNSLSFSISLGAGAKWTSTQASMMQSGEFRGHWVTRGNAISLTQTHEGKKKRKDKLEGILKDGKLHLLHRDNDMDVPYVFVRQK